MLDKYRVESELGRGAMGIVLRATHVHLGEQVALKVLLPEMAANPEIHARFLREAQAVVQLRGEHVARVSDVGLLPDGAPYMVMEYLRGTDLAGEIARRGVLPTGEAVDYVLQACEALAEAHAHGIVHRDVKPSNLFLTSRPDGTPMLKVLDFGISKTPVSGRGGLTATATVMGTPGYMSPEQMKATRDVDARTDIWALGIVLYECLSGRRPFDAEAFSAVVMMVATDPPPPMNSRIPRGLQSAVMRCLAKDRADRFASSADLAAALAPFARDQRAASIVVERTRLLLQGPPAASEPMEVPGPPQLGTTLQGSVSADVTSRRARYAMAGVITFIAAIVASSVVVGTRPPPTTAPAVAAKGAVPPDGNAPVVATAPDATPTGSVAPIVSALPAMPAVDVEIAQMQRPKITPDDERAQIVKCTEAQAQKDWPALGDCAATLRALGSAEKASEFQTKAKQEMQNASFDTNARAALRSGKLKEAQSLLQKIGYNSVYFKSLSGSIANAENAQLEEARRKAQNLANVHYCVALKLFIQTLAESNNGTDRVVATAAAIKCVDKVATAPLAPGTSTTPNVPAGPTGGSGPSTPPSNQLCDTMNVDDVVAQAQNQFQAGFAQSALQLVIKALPCRTDVRMYRTGAIYACAARDEVAAKWFFGNVPTQYQGAIAQFCQQEAIRLP